MNEIWIDIRGYEGFYQVSNIGRVKALAKNWSFGRTKVMKPEIVIKLQESTNGYLQVHLQRAPGTRKKYFVHRLVAAHFVLNPREESIVNHLDRDRHNNHGSNLDWVSPQGNSDHWVADDKLKNEMPF